jgi:hypothetical protein
LICLTPRHLEPREDGRFTIKGNFMLQNVGTVDRVIRIALGLGLIAATVLGHIGPWGWIGVVPLATGVFRFCPAYLPFGLSSCGMKRPVGKP